LEEREGDGRITLRWEIDGEDLRWMKLVHFFKLLPILFPADKY
jgi:hypothetical protein